MSTCDTSPHVKPRATVPALKRRTLACCLLSLFGLLPVRGYAGEAARIEYGPQGLLKLVTELRVVDKTDPSVRLALAPLITFQTHISPKHEIIDVSFLTVPFLEMKSLVNMIPDPEEEGQTRPTIKIDLDTRIPFRTQCDQPLFSLYHALAASTRESAGKDSDGTTPTWVKRWHFLDSPVFCGAQAWEWGQGDRDRPDGFKREWLHTPLITALSLYSNGANRSFGLLTGVATAVHCGTEDEIRSWRILDLSLAHIFRSEGKGDDSKWSLCGLPLFSLAMAEDRDGVRTRVLLASAAVGSRLQDDRGNCTLALWQSTRDSAGRRTWQVFRLPLIGPLAAVWDEDDGRHWGLFARLWNRDL